MPNGKIEGAGIHPRPDVSVEFNSRERGHRALRGGPLLLDGNQVLKRKWITSPS